MKVYKASYYQSFNYGAYQEHERIVVANSENEALGLVLEDEQNTLAKHWDIEEIDITQAGVTYISDRG